MAGDIIRNAIHNIRTINLSDIVSYVFYWSFPTYEIKAVYYYATSIILMQLNYKCARQIIFGQKHVALNPYFLARNLIYSYAMTLFILVQLLIYMWERQWNHIFKLISILDDFAIHTSSVATMCYICIWHSNELTLPSYFIIKASPVD